MLKFPFNILKREYENKVEYFTISTAKNETFVRCLYKDFTLIQALSKIHKNNEKLVYTDNDMYKLIEDLKKMDITTKDKSRWSFECCNDLRELSMFDNYKIQLGLVILPPNEDDYWE